MNRIIYSIAFILFGFIILESFNVIKLMKKDGAAPGYTGSPGDTLKNCTACHGGAAYKVAGWITSNIPAEGYVPNQVYTIKTTNREWGATRFGFEISPQDISGLLLGKIIPTDTFRTKLVGDDKYITYTKNGIEGKDSLSWTFNWQAPAAGTGEVVFYGGFNSNYEGNKGGDQTFLSTLKVKEKTNSVKPLTALVSNFMAYPNPADDVLNIGFDTKRSGFIVLDITDINGNKVAEIMNERSSGRVTKQFRTENLPSGNYVLRVSVDGRVMSRKIRVLH